MNPGPQHFEKVVILMCRNCIDPLLLKKKLLKKMQNICKFSIFHNPEYEESEVNVTAFNVTLTKCLLLVLLSQLSHMLNN